MASPSAKRDALMPALFIGHGHPINAIQRNDFTEALEKAGTRLPRPRAVLVVSAHWLVRNQVLVSGTESPGMIYDFGPFHPDLFKVIYAAPGAPEQARRTAKLIRTRRVGINTTRGFDHGAWTILKYLFPKADIPVFQLSIDFAQPPRFHYDLGRELLPLRKEGVMIIGSGNIVHNLMQVAWDDVGAPPDGWARSFDSTVAGLLRKRGHDELIDYGGLDLADEAVPTNDHYLPMLYTLGLQQEGESVEWLYEGFQYANMSMRCFSIS
ncbi:MAG TPA: 4,5-DOPA dioxygenase extradiol [Syntrophales bacterium]|jgi:4,5-DOPA dioxygenase extradiol